MEYLVLRTFQDALVVEFLEDFSKHIILQTLLYLRSTDLYLCLLLLLTELCGQLNVAWKALKEASGRIKWDLALQIVNPVLEGHHLTDGSLEIDVGAGAGVLEVEHWRLIGQLLWELLNIKLFSERHLSEWLRELQLPLDRPCTLPITSKDIQSAWSLSILLRKAVGGTTRLKLDVVGCDEFERDGVSARPLESLLVLSCHSLIGTFTYWAFVAINRAILLQCDRCDVCDT